MQNSKPQNKFGGKGKASHRGAKGGSGGGKGGGTWMFVPAAAPTVPHRGGKSFGKGMVKGGKGGKGKVMDKAALQRNALMDKLGKVDADHKVWVGGLGEDVKRGALLEHFKTVGKVKEFVILKKGAACVAFTTADDASSAIASLNGSDLNGNAIEVDVWTQKEKKERPEQEKKAKKTKTVIKNQIGKNGKSPMDLKMKEKLKAVDHSLKVWVGGLKPTTTWKELKQHFVDNGNEVKMAVPMKPGTFCVTFETEGEASSAMAVSGTEVDGKTIEVDAWAKPERRERAWEKKKKEEA